MPRLIRIVLLTAAFLMGTWVFGWWAIPAIGLLWGVLARGTSGSAVTAAVAAVLAWAALLGLDAIDGRFGALLARIAPVFTLPGIALVGVTLLLAALLAWSAAAFAGALVRRNSFHGSVASDR